MHRVEEIESAIESLSAADYQRIVEWLEAREQTRWDEQIDRDSSSGKLDFLFEEAEKEFVQGTLRGWPPRV